MPVVQAFNFRVKSEHYKKERTNKKSQFCQDTLERLDVAPEFNKVNIFFYSIVFKQSDYSRAPYQISEPAAGPEDGTVLPECKPEQLKS